jgi:hypothetical protein
MTNSIARSHYETIREISYLKLDMLVLMSTLVSSPICHNLLCLTSYLLIFFT